MTWLVRAEEWLALVLAVSGAVLGFYFWRDNKRDLTLYRARGWDGFAELAAFQGIRSGRAKVALHLMLSVLPAISLATSSLQIPVDKSIFFGAVVVGQSWVIEAQALNWRDRRRLLRKLEQEDVSTHTSPY